MGYIGKKPTPVPLTSSDITNDIITEAKIADNAVENEHLNANVITGHTALTVAPADTDEFLLSDAGTLKRIDYSLIKGGGAFEKLITTTVSSSTASVVFDNTYLTTDYTDYQFRITDVAPTSGGANLRMFVSDDNGSTYETGSITDGYLLANVGTNSINTATNLTSGGNDDNDFNLNNQGIASSETAASFIIDIFDPLNQLSDNKWFHYFCNTIYWTGTYAISHSGGGIYIGTGSQNVPFNAIKFDMDSGNIAKAVFTLYGRKI